MMYLKNLLGDRLVSLRSSATDVKVSVFENHLISQDELNLLRGWYLVSKGRVSDPGRSGVSPVR